MLQHSVSICLSFSFLFCLCLSRSLCAHMCWCLYRCVYVVMEATDVCLVSPSIPSTLIFEIGLVTGPILELADSATPAGQQVPRNPVPTSAGAGCQVKKLFVSVLGPKFKSSFLREPRGPILLFTKPVNCLGVLLGTWLLNIHPCLSIGCRFIKVKYPSSLQ